MNSSQEWKTMWERQTTARRFPIAFGCAKQKTAANRDEGANKVTKARANREEMSVPRRLLRFFFFGRKG